MTSDYSLSDIKAVTDGNNGGLFGGDNGWWLILLFIFIACGWGGFGGGNFGGGGVQDAYVLNSDFSTLSRQISDGFNTVERRTDAIVNGLCDGFYTQAQLVNGVNTNIMQTGYGITNAVNAVGTQVADCCCKTQSGIERVNTGIAMSTGDIKAAIKDCCREEEKMAMQSRFDAAQYNCATLSAIDKLGDRIIDYMAQDKAQALRDENNALRLAASQARQNEVLISTLRPMPVPSYPSCNPWANTAPFGACGCAV